jgi:3-isopropylmalate/(R)-2-methylmalate dehydratase small subunit
MTPFTFLDAVALPITTPNFDTDQVIPARFLSRPREAGLAECLFHDLRFNPDGSERPEFVLNKPEFRDARIVVGERNFACGSSRENAVWALADYGFRAAIAPSFGDIFGNNTLKNGLLPVRLPADVVAGLLAQLAEQPGARIHIDLPTQIVTGPDGAQYDFEIDPFAKHCLLNGVDELDFTLTMADQISAFENRFGRENSERGMVQL